MRGKRILLAFFLVCAASAAAQVRVERGGVSPLARREFDQGPADPALPLHQVTLHFRRTAAQQAALDQLLADQRNPRSPAYHRWLTPEQFADRFGAPPADVARVRVWLESQGVTIQQLARGRNWIAFGGTAQTVGRALGTEFHRYLVRGESHFANATPPRVPAELAPLVAGFMGLDDFRPQAAYTGGDGSHGLAPGDLATIFDITPLYNMGIDGSGQKIAIMGGTDLEPGLADIHAYQRQFNLPPHDPQVVLAGASPGFSPFVVGEADLDIELAQAVAPNAQIVFVESQDPIFSEIYTVDQNLASVISNSSGRCESIFAYLAVLLQSIVQQANAQGITFVSGSGDAGAANCDGWFYEPQASNGLNAFFPASIPEVTAVGGTELSEGAGSFWSAQNNANGGSALSYIPEMAWNDTASRGVLASSGGGPSVLYAKPPWQTGPGVPNDGVRDTPDVAMPASPYHDGYLICTQGTCAPLGGTSASTPVFAGIVALLNQSLVSRGVLEQPGLGNINPELYRLAQSNAGVFHDITSGDNIVPCVAGSANCVNGSEGFAAGPGYDMVTGLGSVDVANLAAAWNLSGQGTSVSVTGAPASMNMGDSALLNISVNALGGGSPAGQVFVNVINAATPLSANPPGALLLGSAVLNPSQLSTAAVRVYAALLQPGANTLVVTYSGDAAFNGSSSTLTISVIVPTGHSVVVPAVGPAYYALAYPPVGLPPPGGEPGFTWGFLVALKEAAGTATTITTLVCDGLDASSLISRIFGSNVLPAGGTLTGAVTLNDPRLHPPATTLIHLAGQDSSGYQWSIDVPVQMFNGALQFPWIGQGGLTNGASFRHSYAPGMIMSVFGNNLTDPGGAQDQAQTLPLPLQLAGASATVNGVPAPFYYASRGQLNVQIPYGTKPGLALLTVKGLFGQTFNSTFTVQLAAPGIFAANGATVPYASGNRGGTYILFITGEGEVTPPLPTGSSPPLTTPISDLPRPVLPVTMSIGGEDTPIVFVGIPYYIAGATQINFTVPDDEPLGPQPVIVSVGGVQSPPVTFTVLPAAP